jgi:putative tricarboxylic transport membrane protein
VIGMFFLATIAPVLADYALKFQTHEYFWLAIFGILIAGQLTAMDDPIKGWIAGFLGLAVAMIGQEGLYMTDRFTFGYTEMMGGVNLIPAMVGAFGFSEVLAVMSRARPMLLVESASERFLPRWSELWRYRRTIGRSGVIGTLIGIIPGVGEDIGAWASYAAAKRVSPERDRFGKGSLEGLTAAETGNSAVVPGALIPALTLAVPGSAPAAVLIAAMFIHGIRPGPTIMLEQPQFVFGVVVMLFFATLAITFYGLALTQLFILTLKVPRERLMGVVFVLCVIGPFAITQRLFDVWVMVAFGVLGYVMRRMSYPMAPLVLGIILGDLLDKNLRRGLILSDGSLEPFLTRPISAVLAAACLLTIAMSVPAVRHGARAAARRLSGRRSRP